MILNAVRWTSLMKRCQNLCWIMMTSFMSADVVTLFAIMTLHHKSLNACAPALVFFLCASSRRENSTCTGTQWCLVFRCYWFGCTQPVLFNLSSHMSSRKAGTAAADWAKSGGNSFFLLYAPNLSLSPCCVKG